MARGIIQVGVDAVKPIAVVPFIYRLRGLDVTLIRPHVEGRVEIGGPGTSPCPELHFTVGVCASGIKEDSLARFHVNSDISFPQIPVDQGWRYLTPVRLQNPQKPRYNPVDELLARSVVFQPLTICFIVILDHVFKLMGKRFRPALFPDHRTFHFATHGGNGESKQAIGGQSFSMEICYPRHKMTWIGSGRKVHIVKVSEKEVYLCFAIVILSPPSCFRHKSWYYGVDCRYRIEFALHERSGALTCRTLSSPGQGLTKVGYV